MPHEISPAELETIVLRFKNGDDSARDELIQFSFDRLKRLTRKMLGDFPAVRRWEETDDVFQRSTLRLWEALKQVRPESSRHFFNLGALQVRRELIDLSRSLNGPLGLHQNQESVEAEQSLAAANRTYDSSRLAAWTDFHEGVDRLPEESREVFQLIWYQGLRQEVVAGILGISQKTVSRRWQDSRRELYDLLGGSLPE